MTQTSTTRGGESVLLRRWLLWFGALVVVTIVLALLRQRLNAAHITLAYLLLVQGGSARGGRPLGFALAAVSFVCFDLFFLPPFGTLVIQDPLNWLVLVAFLGTSILSAQLLYRAQEEAEIARLRAAEIDRLAALGAETLNAARAEEALTAIVAVIRSSIGIDDCVVQRADDASIGDDPTNARAMKYGVSAAERLDGTMVAEMPGDALTHGELRTFVRPLRVRERTVGILRIADPNGIRLSAEQIRVLDALAYYAALGVERLRLVAEAERAVVLQEAHRAKDAVLASVSHDLRTPLTTIKGIAHEIAASGDERAEVIEEEADRLNAFVAQMLDLSRIAAGTAASDVQANEAEDLLGAAAQQASGRLAGRRLHIAIRGDDPLLFGRFDFAQTLRALVNLIDNAAKYSPIDAPIDLSASREGRMLVFSVADRGPGVPPGERERIFEAFYRPADAAPDVGGTGLGLSIARGIARAQGGEVSFAERAGGGSVFRLSVPAIPFADLPTAELQTLDQP